MMSAASDPPPGLKTLASGTPSGGAVIRPQPVTEKSLMESVAGFIHDVQAIHHTHLGAHAPNNDPKVHVTWARFETTDLNDVRLLPDSSESSGNASPLLLILGYTQGVQIWLVPINGEAKEVLSWKRGSVKTLRVLPKPENSFGVPDNFAHCRPLIALADATGPGAPFTSVSFLSLKTGEQVHNIKFNSEIADIVVNRRVVVISFREKFALFDACSLDARFTITSCYPSPGVHSNPISLGDRWLAYADQKLVPIHRSFGGMECDGSQSVAAWSINVGSKLAQGMSKIYSNFFSGGTAGGQCNSAPSSLSGSRPYAGVSPSSSGRDIPGQNEPQKGVVTILDVMTVGKTESDEVNITHKIAGVVAHFIAHNKAIVSMQFDSSGSLLLTCDKNGNYFNLFRLVPHPAGSCYSAVHHLYSLYRGDTPGSVQDIAFSSDSRWVAVSTLRGTSHIFPITPYGGPVGVRTHTSARVVNKLSRFHRSAGFDDYHTSTTGTSAANSSGRTSPNPNLAGTSPVVSSFSKMSMMEAAAAHAGQNSSPLIVPHPNPHIPPFPSPTVVQPVAQLRQPYIVTLTNQTIGSATAVTRKKSGGSSQSSEEVPIRLACKFAPSRAWLVGAQHNMFNRRHLQRPHDALYVMANHGEKICESSPIELVVTPYGQWSLSQPRDKADLQPPLPIDNPLMLPVPTHSFGKALSQEDDNEDKWLSQVEIITHFGPHRRLWMGPQFCFKTLQPADNEKDGNIVKDLDISLPARPEQSNPVNMPPKMKHQGHPPTGRNPVLIEAGSASSFELSPHFSNAFQRHPGHAPANPSAKDSVLNVENELQEAMSETIGEESLLDGTTSNPTRRASSGRQPNQIKTESSEEEFFCLTPEDARSRNVSATSKAPVQHNTVNDTKIFSVAVESRRSQAIQMDSMRVCDVDSDFTGRFAVVQKPKGSIPKKEAMLEPIKAEVIPAPPKAVPVEETRPISPPIATNKSNKKGKKNKNKSKNKGSSIKSSSSADECQVEEPVAFTVVKKLSTAQERETTPLEQEMTTSFPWRDDDDQLVQALVESTQDIDLMSSSDIKTDDQPHVEVEVEDEDEEEQVEQEEQAAEVSTHSDEFQEITNRKASDDTTEDDEEDEDDDDEDEEEGSGSEPFNIDRETSAKPEVPFWVDDLLKSSSTDNAILNSIVKAEQKYDAKKKMTQSTGFVARSVSQPAVLNSESVDSSEDDLEFKPVSNGRRRKKQPQLNLRPSMSHTEAFRSRGSSFADSESSFNGDEVLRDQDKEGWSFEADDLDVNKFLSEAIASSPPADLDADEGGVSGEKPQLEDVFKFDSEIAAAEGQGVRVSKQNAASLEDLKEALGDEEEKMTSSLNVTFDEDNLVSSSSARESLALSTSIGETTDSSVGNSPNPKKNK
eukprot:TCALIF_11520-PA protein Name:"Similar to rudhira Breast carcinoma-amplified sequence 3 homolog (Drosophila melanogaster)" AED:0.12 eAED:0.12 QI:210/0.88/0.7/1/0.77/0.6/10/0/1394